MLLFAISYCFVFLIWFCFASLYAVLICLDTLFFLFCVCFSFFSIKQTAWDTENKLEKNEYSEHLSWIIEEYEIILSFMYLLTEQRSVSCSHISDQPQTVHQRCRLYAARNHSQLLCTDFSPFMLFRSLDLLCLLDSCYGNSFPQGLEYTCGW